MSKRKYTRFGETAVAYECTKKKCKWQGSHEQKVLRPSDDFIGETLACPECGNNEFYGLLTPLKNDTTI